MHLKRFSSQIRLTAHTTKRGSLNSANYAGIIEHSDLAYGLLRKHGDGRVTDRSFLPFDFTQRGTDDVPARTVGRLSVCGAKIEVTHDSTLCPAHPWYGR
jgi:hypothetical protein